MTRLDPTRAVLRSRQRGGFAVGFLALVAAWSAGAAEQSQVIDGPVSPAVQPAPAAPALATHKELCDLIETAAKDHGLPVQFFTALIWKESRFRSDAVSPKGAQGIAQFMPGTAAERGLLDPFDPATAIPASASLLADHKARFGNLGLAAAAYNAGAERVANWLADEAVLPWETQDFVATITGAAADLWASGDPLPELAPEDADKTCLALAAKLKKGGQVRAQEVATVTAPWGVQVAGNYSRTKALAAYATLQKKFPGLLASRAPMVISTPLGGRGKRVLYRVRVPAQTRQEAQRVCEELRQAGGDCIVFRT